MANIAAVSLAIGYPTAASVPHSIVNGFKVCVCVFGGGGGGLGGAEARVGITTTVFV